MKNQHIVPHLWFDAQAEEAVDFYTSIFPQSKLNVKTYIEDTPSGDTPSLSFELMDYKFMAISAGPYFTLNPAISFMLLFNPASDEAADGNLESLWNKLMEGGTALMPLDAYPFSSKYGWVQDKHGVTWQLILSDGSGPERSNIVPAMMFVGENHGRAKEAIEYYVSIFPDSEVGEIAQYPGDMPPHTEGTVMYGDFRLGQQWFSAMDSAEDHDFNFNEAVSLMVQCKDQQEIDYYWEKLSAVPEAEQCGWLKDKFGVSWQIYPTAMEEMMAEGTREQINRVTEAFLKMKKFDIATLEKAYRGENS
ncbi:VOC family protein [Salinicoccus sp. ID82-1]|uniref:VOC family protein n=1 Tax=Salinicoccus sp. ID82-1 TaxID=2820269 RepID=UPI001F2620F4|nr:VOC family protein [Salinicoccus sp. ID82-1]MCG1008975.1 VOC family protein [Salinicoccus sp. ID82-1]